ncbi:MAG: AarF/ABC1/UbiB kinase family protein [Bdellovibrionota bacterium]
MAFSLRENPFGKTLKNASRLRTIASVFAKHGFHKLLEQIRLGQFLLERMSASSEIENFSVAERVRMSFEELGPTFVKLGQLLATRPDLVPQEYVVEFTKLHASVNPLPFETIEAVLLKELGPDYKTKFLRIDPHPLGSASIAQVHAAQLLTGEDVVIKVQRPGILQVINDDLGVLYFLAELLYKYVPETRMFNPLAIVDEYFKSLELETNFIVEANNIRRFQEHFSSRPEVRIPKVYYELTTEKILVMQMMTGIPLSDDRALHQETIAPQEIIKLGLSAYLKMVFIDGLFHGDLHAGNFFVLPNNHIGLIDFGLVGRLNPKTQTAIANMLFALSKEDYERLAYEYVDLAPFTDQINVDLFARELRELIAPHYGLTLKNVNLGKLLMTSAGIAARHRLVVPSELMMFFKSIIAIEGIGRKISPGFDFLQYSLEFSADLIKHQFDPSKIAHDMSQVARESKNFLNALPRQLNFLIRKLNSPNHHFRFQLVELEDMKRSIESSFNLLFLGVVIAALILSGSLVYVHPNQELMLGMPMLTFILYSLAGILGVVGFFNYIRKP